MPDNLHVTLDRASEMRLSLCKSGIKHGNWVALAEAISLCLEARRLAPPWLLVAMAQFLSEALQDKVQKRRGRGGNALAKFRKDMVHYIRTDAVSEIREKQKEIAADLDRAKKQKLPASNRQYLENIQERVGRTWVDAYQAAHEMLRGTAAQGSPDSMMRSYKLVTKIWRDTNEAGRIIGLSRSVYRLLGIDDLLEAAAGRRHAGKRRKSG